MKRQNKEIEVNTPNSIRSCKLIDNETESSSNNKHDRTNCDHTDKELEKRERRKEKV